MSLSTNDDFLSCDFGLKATVKTLACICTLFVIEYPTDFRQKIIDILVILIDSLLLA